LEQRLKANPISASDAQEITQSIADGLAFLHGRGMVHRDLKPGNVLRIEGQWQIADFGLVRAFGDDSAAYTQTLAGTPHFMPPESFRGEVSPAWDVWSLGVVLVVALTRQYPFSGTSQHEVANAIMQQEPRIPASLPAPFDAIVRGCLIKDRRQRWSAKQVLTALTSKAASVPVSPPQPVVPSRSQPQPKPPSVVTQQTIPAAHSVKRSAVPAGLWGFGGLVMVGIIVANLLSANRSSIQPVSAPTVAHHAWHATKTLRASVQRVVRTQTIPFSIQRIRTASLASGQTQVQQQGHAGEMSVAYEVKTRHGHVISRHAVSRRVAQAPVTEVLLVGAHQEAPKPEPAHVASVTPPMHRTFTVAYAPKPHNMARHAVVYHRSIRASVGDLHSESSIGTASSHDQSSSTASSSDDSGSLH